MEIVSITDEGKRLSQNDKQYYAEFTYWNGETEVLEIKEEHIQDILYAVMGQYTFVNNKTGLIIHGAAIMHVDILTNK